MIKNKIVFSILFVFVLTTISAQEGEEVRADALKLYQDGFYAQSVDVCLAELQEYSPEQIDRRMSSYTVLGWALIKLGRWDEAIQYSLDALNYVSYDNRVVETLAEAYYYKGNNLKALEYFEQYVNLNSLGPRIQTVYHFMGEIYIRMGEYKHADIAFSTALYHNQNLVDSWYRLGYARELGEDYSGAVEALEQALVLSPYHADAIEALERVKREL